MTSKPIELGVEQLVARQVSVWQKRKLAEHQRETKDRKVAVGSEPISEKWIH